ncbi:peptidylprolyl isomerase [Oscillatoria sp. CS-180]|uniref:peptidylprolyl isomerase n=1 Tax=Oscillatoria sp. CS-180 TaxID=3021720 RepID=UPI00232F3C97|nr:peptidylprolyl isomerase [Oscillatoria sp. CS-180]MDB9525450.1 peptidylprolyl isomerase [Oscillatoria sp. CS-180]
MMIQFRHWSWMLCLVFLLLSASACTGGDTAGDVSPEAAPDETAVIEEMPEAASEEAESPTESDAVSTGPITGLPTLDGTATVEMQINGDVVVMELDGSQAPVTAGNFVDLVQRGVYDGVLFHRVEKPPKFPYPFVVQGGDPNSTDPDVPLERLGTGGFVDPDTQQERSIPLEIQPANADEPIYGEVFQESGILQPPALRHTRGAVAMARSPQPNSASSQFYIALSDLPSLDGSYAVFGYVTEGMDVVDSIEAGDMIESATVVSGIENLNQPE